MFLFVPYGTQTGFAIFVHPCRGLEAKTIFQSSRIWWRMQWGWLTTKYSINFLRPSFFRCKQNQCSCNGAHLNVTWTMPRSYRALINELSNSQFTRLLKFSCLQWHFQRNRLQESNNPSKLAFWFHYSPDISVEFSYNGCKFFCPPDYRSLFLFSIFKIDLCSKTSVFGKLAQQYWKLLLNAPWQLENRLCCPTYCFFFYE